MSDHPSPSARETYDLRREALLDRRRQWLASPRGRMRTTFSVVATAVIMTFGALAMLAVAAVTLFQAHRFYRETMCRGLARAVLWANGVCMVVHRDRPFPEEQTIYISNHTSTLDVFILLALGLPNSRYFMGGFLRKIVPLGIVTHIMGTFHTPPQSKPEKRIRCFQHAERVLRKTGESVYLSPEGRRVTDGSIGPFNKGTFHLATNLQVPLFPFYIDIPPDVDPGRGNRVVPGTVEIHLLPEMPTRGWVLDDLLENKTSVREVFLQFQKHLRYGTESAPGRTSS